MPDEERLTDFTTRGIINNLQGNKFGKYYQRHDLEKSLFSLIENDDIPIILVHGKGGAGKSSLVYNVVYKIISGEIFLSQNIDKVFWFSDAYQPGELTIHKVINEIKFACNVTPSTTYNSIDGEIASISQLFDRKKLSIIVIDNFETITDPEVINFILYKMPIGCKVILTSKFAPRHYKERGLISNRLGDSIEDLPVRDFTFEEWEKIFNEKTKNNQRIERWVSNVTQATLNAILKHIYTVLDGNIFGMWSVVSQIANHNITKIEQIKKLLEDNDGLLQESFDRIIEDSWKMLSVSAQLIMLTAMLQGSNYLDFAQIQQFTKLGEVYNGDIQINSKLDIALGECIDLNLMEKDYRNNSFVYYLSPLVYRFVSFQLKNHNAENSTVDLEKEEFQSVISNWIAHYKDIAHNIGFCYDNTKKMRSLDEPNKRACLSYVLDFCYAENRFADFVAIARDLRYFFYTRAIWTCGNNCIHIKRANAAKQIGDYKEEFEALIYYINIASKYNQLSDIEPYIDRVNEICRMDNFIQKNPDSYFRFKHVMGLYCYALRDFDSALGHWSEILDQPILTDNVHDIDAAKRWRLKCSLEKGDVPSERIIEMCQDLLTEAQNHNFERSIVDFSLVIANEYIKLGEKDKAKLYLNTIANLVNTINDILYSARYYLYLALCIGPTDEGCEYLKQSIDLCKDSNISHELLILKQRIANIDKFVALASDLLGDCKLQVIFLRHMPTANNLKDLFVGRLDLDCDFDYADEHKADIVELRERFKDIKTIYCSPLKRAMQTASQIFPDKEYIVDQRIIERDLGVWSNESKEDLMQRYPMAFYANGIINFSYTPEGGEDFSNLILRVAQFLKEMVAKHESETIIVITHNGIITTAKCIMSDEYDDTSSIEFQPYFTPYIIEIDEQKLDIITKIVEKGI